MAELFEIKDSRRPNPDVVGIVEELLEMAKSGEITGLVATVRTSGGEHNNAFAGHIVTTTMLGALRLADWHVADLIANGITNDIAPRDT